MAEDTLVAPHTSHKAHEAKPINELTRYPEQLLSTLVLYKAAHSEP
jgi:hypothetical protein